MEKNRVIDEGKAHVKKPRKKRWSKDDTELFLLSLPTLLWFLTQTSHIDFSYAP